MKTLPELLNHHIPSLRERLKVDFKLGIAEDKDIDAKIQSMVIEIVNAFDEIATIPAPTPRDRKETPGWSGVIDTQIENLTNAKQYFIKGI